MRDGMSDSHHPVRWSKLHFLYLDHEMSSLNPSATIINYNVMLSNLRGGF